MVVAAGAMNGFYAPGTLAELRLEFPKGLKCAACDPFGRVELTEDARPRTYDVRIEGNGTFTVRASLRIDDARGVIRDREDLSLTLTVDGDSVRVQPVRTVRQVRMVGKQPYRFGGSFLVPIDDHETATQDEILGEGTRPIASRKRSAACRNCAAMPEAVSWLVCLDPQGRIREFRPLSSTPGDSSAVEITRRALAEWRFRPATLRSRPVSDCLAVEVPIRRGR